MLSGFDRLRLRGTLRRVANVQGLATFLGHQRGVAEGLGGICAGRDDARLPRAVGAGLNPLAADDAALLAIVYRGEFVITGLRNRDVRRLLYGEVTEAATRRQRAGQVTRHLRLLRGHGLLRKVSHTHRYLLTAKGRVVVAALLAARQAGTTTLAAAA